MKFKKDRDILRFLGIAVLLTLTGILIMSFLSGPTYFRIGFALILMGVISTVAAICVAATDKLGLIADERFMGISEKAGYYALWILIATMALLQLINIMWELNLGYGDVVPYLFIIGMLLFSILRWYYNQRGDVR
jgi:uncharacterized membrane protein